MQPETATLPAAMKSTLANNPGESTDRPAFRRPQYWLALFVFWTALPFVLVPVLDMAWGHQVKFPRLTIYMMLQWWAWVPLTPLVAALGRRFPLREAGVPSESKWNIVRHALIHLLASWLIAVGLILYLAAMAALMPVEWSAALILSKAFHVFEGFGALFQLVYWAVLAASLALASYQRSRGRSAG